MTEVIVLATLDFAEARELTDEVKGDVAVFAEKLLRLYEGDAHTALGYSSWAAYCKAEFKSSDATAYRTLQAARIMRQLPIGSPEPASESVARELSPLLSERPEEIPVVWGEVVEQHGPAPTAAQVREVVQDHAPESAKPEPEYTSCPTCGHRVRADKPLSPRKENQ